ncbi:hypothetical protein [Pseudomonas carassii]|uniref:Uncharacterized protein n=1 Tax=Pseudomonas carassii TaxID=3115855 RepID=A0ABU7H7W3_9PSED|nr:hypothetical protein [Pseudomonas sp. 137P]MEE1887411.1 hypothetical protein [Pseudomonas sp. 137P]
MAFVITCLICGAISKEELNFWCAGALSLDKVPVYICDLMGFQDEVFKVYKIIGFVPYWEHSDVDEYALYGIAVRRGFEPYDMPLTPSEALAHLEASPDIENSFREVFSFIKL